MRSRLIIASGVGTVAGLLYLLGRNGQENQKNGKQKNDRIQKHKSKASCRTTEEAAANAFGPSAKAEEHENVIVNDQRTDQIEAASVLKNIRDAAFDSSDEKLALALGRPTEEIEAWTNGTETIDSDVVMKARALALNRGIEL